MVLLGHFYVCENQLQAQDQVWYPHGPLRRPLLRRWLALQPHGPRIRASTASLVGPARRASDISKVQLESYILSSETYQCTL